jgi:GT2 family glycosyltransferase
MRRIGICLPFYKIMETYAVESLLGMLSSITNRGDKYILFCVHGMGIAVARNKTFDMALEQELDYILSLDTDHIYSAEVLYKLIQDLDDYDLQMVSAAYASRGNAEPVYAHVGFPDESGSFKNAMIKLGSVSGLVDTYAVGFGFVLLRPEFVKKMKETFGLLFRWSDDKYIGEDIYFCRNAAKLGARVCFDADARVWHLGTVKF